MTSWEPDGEGPTRPPSGAETALLVLLIIALGVLSIIVT